jgi:glycine cleavage system transcriptional repressor
MIHHAVLTAIGADRPGLVDEVSRFIVERGGNLEDSRMVNLHGQFAMMILVAGPEETMVRMRDELSELERVSAVHAQIVAADAERGGVAAALPFRLQTWAMDHPGLLQAVSHLLSSMGANIESVQTSLQGAPMTGTPVFSMEIIVSVPATAAIAELRTALGRLCDDQNMDWRLTAL